MKTIYLNTRQYGEVETIDEFTKDKKTSQKDFNIYVNKMVKEYSIAGINVYKSIRSTKLWKRD